MDLANLDRSLIGIIATYACNQSAEIRLEQNEKSPCTVVKSPHFQSIARFALVSKAFLDAVKKFACSVCTRLVRPDRDRCERCGCICELQAVRERRSSIIIGKVSPSNKNECKLLQKSKKVEEILKRKKLENVKEWQ